LLWLTGLIRVTQSPKLYQIFTHAILLFCCFTIRHTGYYYAMVSVTGFILSRQAIWRKVLGVTLPLVLIVPFVMHTESVAYKLTGARQFSLLTGWQLANNALYIYDFIKVDSNRLPDQAARDLNRIGVKFYRGLDQRNKDEIYDFSANFFVVRGDGALKQY